MTAALSIILLLLMVRRGEERERKTDPFLGPLHSTRAPARSLLAHPHPFTHSPIPAHRSSTVFCGPNSGSRWWWTAARRCVGRGAGERERKKQGRARARSLARSLSDPPPLTPASLPFPFPFPVAQGELLRVNFNVSFPALSCEFLTLDVSDALGTKRVNITKTVRKLPLKADGERAGFYMHDDLATAPVVYDAPGAVPAAVVTDDYDHPIDAAHFQGLVDKHPVVVVNFYAPWCTWCQRLEPTWDAVAAEVKARYPESDGRLRLAKVDCTVEVALCRAHQITGFPSLRVFRKVKK